ncbi:PREDICTED: F-box/LRR-repeat At3g48880 [Prunus dulcis]|uniref:PREDICTED: F-box/LRR-repeat At3g48880 n=1 Tax=Prunus dulcis TaxID=3755 RepID=A0A5E4FBQ1_PRUDU|nr:PREDICTED: F-box/LRR-repeat At3g48880 [Prunus dulcis]
MGQRLANVFVKVGIESLLLFVPFVCKFWYRASQNLVCWERLVFPDSEEEATNDPWSLDDYAANLPWTYANRIEGQSFNYFTRRFVREFEIDYSRFPIRSFIKMVINHSCNNAKFLKIPEICSYYVNAIEKILERDSQI